MVILPSIIREMKVSILESKRIGGQNRMLKLEPRYIIKDPYNKIEIIVYKLIIPYCHNKRSDHM
jgi:hypothetical protein